MNTKYSSDQPLRMSLRRKREILWAVVWRGLCYNLVILIAIGFLTYLFSETAWRFFLYDDLNLDMAARAFLYLWLIIPSMLLGWVLAVNRVLHLRFSHFRITLTATPYNPSPLEALLTGIDTEKKPSRKKSKGKKG